MSEPDALYIPCPRCEGRCQVHVYTRLPTEFRPAVGEYISCPLCGGTGEAERETARRWIEDHEDEEG